MLEPGELVFSYQYESLLPGKVFTYKGDTLRSETYKGGTIFCDCASGFIILYNQVSFTEDETVISKVKFEKESLGRGIIIQNYRTDNGVYTSREFLEYLFNSGKTITHSGVGGHHQNGVAENAIKNMVRLSRAMMIYNYLRWPKFVDKSLWPLELQHAVYLHNNTPRMDTTLSPNEVCTRTKSRYSYIRNSHPWGCPIYVLDPRLQDGQKFPKWNP